MNVVLKLGGVLSWEHVGWKDCDPFFMGHPVYNYWDLSNEVLYNVLSQGALKLPEVKDLDLCNLLNKGWSIKNETQVWSCGAFIIDFSEFLHDIS